MTIAALLPIALQLSMALIIFCVALDARFADLTFLWRRPGLLLRSLIAMLVVMPVFALTMSMAFDLPRVVAIALLASALSPVPPILPNKQLKAGGGESYVVGLLTTTALVSVVYIPLAAALLERMFHVQIDVSIQRIVKIVVMSMLLPAVAGMAVRHWAPAIAKRIDKPLTIAATVVLVAVCIPIAIKEWPDMMRLVGNHSVVAMIAFALVGLAVGHWFGGPDADNRSVLALASSARHPAVAMAIAHNAVDQPGVLAAVLLTLVVGAVVSIPYAKWRAGSHARAQAAGTHPS
jgi:BASS family bile acid:Na+ symporter